MYVTHFMQWTDHDKQKLSLVLFSIVYICRIPIYLMSKFKNVVFIRILKYYLCSEYHLCTVHLVVQVQTLVHVLYKNTKNFTIDYRDK